MMLDAVEESKRPTASTGHIGTADNIDPKTGRPSLKQSTFHWTIKHK